MAVAGDVKMFREKLVLQVESRWPALYILCCLASGWTFKLETAAKVRLSDLEILIYVLEALENTNFVKA
jgi:hypothetical protein